MVDGLDRERRNRERKVVKSGCIPQTPRPTAGCCCRRCSPLQSATDRPKLQGCKSPFSSSAGWPTIPSQSARVRLRPSRDGDNDGRQDFLLGVTAATWQEKCQVWHTSFDLCPLSHFKFVVVLEIDLTSHHSNVPSKN